MKLFLLGLLSIQTALPLVAQNNRGTVDQELQPYTMRGHFSLRHNLHFAGYSTHRFHRQPASWFSFGNFSIANAILKIHGVSLYKKEKNRSVDIFSFGLKTASGLVSQTECRAVMRKNETFSLFKPTDSSFFKIKNVD